MSRSPSEIEGILAAAGAAARPLLGQGQVATYIPALARVDPRQLGLAVATLDGRVHAWGDAEVPFSIQSISKVFGLALALRDRGEAVFERVGREASGSAFNSIVQLEREGGIPRNPFINAGAIAVSDLLGAIHGWDRALDVLLGFVRRAASDPTIAVDDEVARSEATTGARNRSLAWFLRGFGTIEEVRPTLGIYFQQCAIAMTAAQLARAGLFLAADGRDPVKGEPLVSSEVAQRVNALMMTCGHYDASGDFAFRVGLPGKSGVGGGILAVAPGRAALAAWSPALSAQGTSLAGARALEVFAQKTGWSCFRP